MSTKVDSSVEGIDLEALLRFLSVAESGSFSAAARLLGVSRQAVHRSVDALEAGCGAPLLERHERAMRLTALGKSLQSDAQSIRSSLRAVRAKVALATEKPSGLIRLTAPPVFGEAVLARAVSRFLARWPAVQLEVRLDSARTELQRDDFDVMIRVGFSPPASSYAVLLAEAPLVLCAAPGWARDRGLAHPDDLSRLPVLEYGDRPAKEWRLTGGEGPVVVPINSRLHCNNARVLQTACRDGQGVLLIPRMGVQDALAAGELVTVLDGWTPPRVHIHAVYGHRSDADPTLAALLAELRLEVEAVR
jgi:DNA-binding transcriptional LysR family regulator